MIADVGVDAVGKVNGRRAHGEVDDVALGGEDEDLVGKHVDLQVVEEVLRVGLLLALQQAANPGEFLLVALAHDAAAAAHLVFPVRRDAVFGSVVHVPGADLHLEGDALRADDGGVQALVHVGLGRGDIILEAPGDGLEHVVYYAQDIVTVGNGVDDHAEGAEIEDALHVELLGVHFAVYAVDVLDAAEDGGVDLLRCEAGLDLLLNGAHEGLKGGHAVVEILGDLPVALRIEVLQREILELPFGALHAEAVRDGRVDLHRLQRLGALLLWRLIGHRAHVVRAVGDLDEDDADVLGHGHEHLAQVLHLLVFLAGVLHARQLGDALHDVRDGGAEFLGDIVMREGSVLDHVVQQRRHDGVLVQTHVHRNIGRGDTVSHIGGAVAPLLPLVSGLGHLVGCADALQIHLVPAAGDLGNQRRKHLVGVEQFVFGFRAFFVHCLLLAPAGRRDRHIG